MSWEKTRRRRQILFDLDPHCYWCGCEVFIAPKGSRLKGKARHGTATLDHLRPRLHPLRREPNPMSEERTVLACWKCNNDRNREDQRTQPREVLWRRSNAYPKSHPEARQRLASA